MRQFKSKFARRGGRLTRSTKTFPGSDWREALNQRAREINAFRRASLPLPNFETGMRGPALKKGEVIRLERPVELTWPPGTRLSSSPPMTQERQQAATNPIGPIRSVARALHRRLLRLIPSVWGPR